MAYHQAMAMRYVSTVCDTDMQLAIEKLMVGINAMHVVHVGEYTNDR